MYKMLYEFFHELSLKAPDLVSVIIAGNHDSAGRLEAPGALLKRASVEAIGSLQLHNGRINLQRHLIRVERRGKPAGYILAIPYLRPADLPDFTSGNDKGASSPMIEAVRNLYQQAIRAARQQIGGLPLVVTGHLHVQGASLSESLSERRIVIGGEHAVPPDVFGDEADYVALGHLHRAQSLGGVRPETRTKYKNTAAGSNSRQKSHPPKADTKGRQEEHRVRYAGSPLPLSVVERPYDHGVSLVNITRSSFSMQHLSLKRPVDFLRVPEKGRLALDEVEEALEALALDGDLPEEQWPFVQIALKIKGPQTGIRGQLDEICTRFALRDVAPDIKWPQRRGDGKKTPPLKRLGELSPEDLFKEAFFEHYGTKASTEHITCFRQLVDEVGS